MDSVSNVQTPARDVPGLQHHFHLAPRSQPQQPTQHANWSTPPPPGARAYVPLIVGERKSKMTAALLAFFLGAFGAHRFYLGYTALGIVMLSVTLVGTAFCCVGFAVTFVWAMVEFVLILMDQLRDSNGLELD